MTSIDGNNIDKLENVKEKVNDVTIIMKKNIDDIIMREQSLNELEGKSLILSKESSIFLETAKKLKRKFCFKNCKIISLVVGFFFLILLIIILSTTIKK